MVARGKLALIEISLLTFRFHGRLDNPRPTLARDTAETGLHPGDDFRTMRGSVYPGPQATSRCWITGFHPELAKNMRISAQENDVWVLESTGGATVAVLYS